MGTFRTAMDWLAAGRDVALVSVVATRGSVPRHAGSRMLVAATGETFATIGGGRVEKEVVEVGAAIAAGAKARVVSHHLVRDLAMCCGGSMDVLVEPLGRSRDVLQAIVAAHRSREPVTIRCQQDAAIEVTPGATERGVAWDGHQFVERRWPNERAILFGAGHLATALVGPLSRVGFDIVVCDDNEIGAADRLRRLAPDLFGDGGLATTDNHIVDSFEVYDVERVLGPLGGGDFAIVLTREHSIDQRLVEQLLAKPNLTYVGLIGSLGKVGRFKKRVLAKGIIDETTWTRLTAPIGLDIAAETPDEIAISIAADLIQRRVNLRRGPL